MSKRETLKRLLRYLLNDKAGFAVAAVFLLLAVVADISGPWLIRIFLDEYVAKNHYRQRRSGRSPLVISP